MAEEFNIINADLPQEGGSEIPAEQLDAINIVANNINEIIKVAGAIDSDGHITITSVDGNTATIQLRRQTATDWGISDPVLAIGEAAWTIPDPGDTLFDMRIGDGVTIWSELVNVLAQSDSGDIGAIRDEAVAAKDEAVQAAADAETQKDAAIVSATDAGQSAIDAQNWATAPITTPLPGGKVSAEVSAGQAAQVALTSRFIDRGVLAGDETFTSASLFKKRRYLGSGLATVTIPSGIFNDSLDREAWSIIRKEGSGSVKVVGASGGTNLQTPSLLARGVTSYRYSNAERGAGVTGNIAVSITMPAVTDGRLVVVTESNVSDSTGFFVTCSATGITFTNPYPITIFKGDESNFAAFEAPRVGTSAGTITVNIAFGTNPNYINVHWFVLEGTAGAMVAPISGMTLPAAANVSVTTASIAAASRIFACAGMRQPTAAFSNFTAFLTTLAFGNTLGQPNTAVQDTLLGRNGCWGVGAGVANATGPYTIQANFASAISPPGLIVFAYGPKTVTGAGNVDLRLEHGRDTLSVDNGEMELLFWPDGKTVTVKTPTP